MPLRKCLKRRSENSKCQLFRLASLLLYRALWTYPAPTAPDQPDKRVDSVRLGIFGATIFFGTDRSEGQ